MDQLSILLVFMALVVSNVLPPTGSGPMGVSGQFVYGDRSGSGWDTARPPPVFGNADSWVSEELWPKEKSLIHVKLIKPLPKEISIWELRNKDSYLSDLSMDFDAPYATIKVKACLVELKSYYDGQSSMANHEEMGHETANIQAQITGGLECAQLPLEVLTPLAENLTHLIVRDTGLEVLPRFLFGTAKLERLLRLDIVSNSRLRRVEGRAFDGLTRISYVALINNEAIEHLDLEAFAGVKSLEELIYIGNGVTWDRTAFANVLRAASSLILPSLIHLHICGTTVKVPQSRDHHYLDEPSSHRFHREAKAKRAKMVMQQQNITSRSQRTWTASGVKLQKDDLNFTRQVKYLQLSDCDITSIHPLAFAPVIKNLVALNLGGNERLNLKSLKSALTVFYSANGTNSKSMGQNKLDKLDLSNSITTRTVPKDLLIVISKTNISELYFNMVLWTSIRAGDFPPMPRIKVLRVDNSQLIELSEESFIGLESLAKLSLRGNYINEAPLSLLEPLTKLQFLDLSGYIEAIPQPLYIPKKFFLYGTNLKEVNLSYKNLDPLPRNFFLGLFKTEKLHLRGCGLKFIEYLTFFPLKSIAYLDLSENYELISSIRETHEDTFVGLEAVEMVRMSHCNITSQDLNDFNIFKRIQEHVQLLDLSHNKLVHISKSSFVNFTELRHLDLSHNNISSWANYTIFSKNNFITTLDMSNNHISHLTAEMIGDFRKLKNLSFAENPLECSCLWRGPLLLLGQKEASMGAQNLLRRNFHEQIEQQLQSLVRRQQEIVSEAFSSPAQAPPNSVLDWLNATKIHFLKDRHPLRSNDHYFCRVPSSDTGGQVDVVFKKYFETTCTSRRPKKTTVSFALLSVTATFLLLLTVMVLVIAFVYHSSLRTLFNMVEDDFLREYDWDAFVSYSMKDADWVFQHLVPSLEDNGLASGNDKESLQKQVTALQSSELKSSTSCNRIRLCVYDRDFIAGRAISDCITESIKTSRKVILVVSNNFVKSQWCRFETDLAHNTLMDQNREGLILIKLEEVAVDMLEKVAPQLHFLMKTRIYLEWPSESTKEQELFWKKLRRALGFAYPAPYGTVKQYYKNYWYRSRRDKLDHRSHDEQNNNECDQAAICCIETQVIKSNSSELIDKVDEKVEMQQKTKCRAETLPDVCANSQ